MTFEYFMKDLKFISAFALHCLPGFLWIDKKIKTKSLKTA